MKTAFTAWLLFGICASPLAAEGKPKVLVKTTFDASCAEADLDLFPDCEQNLRQNFEAQIANELAVYLSQRAETGLYFSYVSEDPPASDPKHATLEFHIFRAGKLSVSVSMKVISAPAFSRRDNNVVIPPTLAQFIPLPFAQDVKGWFAILQRALNDSLSKNSEVTVYLQHGIVYGRNARMNQNGFVLPLKYSELEIVSHARFLISDDENWYCGSATGMPYTAADVPDMNYPAIAVVKLKPPPRNAVWLQKPIVCSDKVGGTNNFYLNQIDPRPE